MKPIDADALEKEGWYINRIIQTDKNTMEYQTKKPTEFPAIEPKRKPGKWIDKEVVDDRKDAKIQQWQQARCSVCNKWHTTPYMYYFNDYDFCPNCGTDMRGNKDG